MTFNYTSYKRNTMNTTQATSQATFDPLKGLAMVLHKDTGHYLIDGVTGRTLLYTTLGTSMRVYRLASQRGLRLVNEESDKGKAILRRLHSHATARSATSMTLVS